MPVSALIADATARSIAEVGLGFATEKLAETKTDAEQAELFDEALRHYQRVFYDNSFLREGETPVTEWVRFRTLGCMPCTGAVKSGAQTIDDIVEEALIATRSERETRVIDHGANTMEDKKREGYF